MEELKSHGFCLAFNPYTNSACYGPWLSGHFPELSVAGLRVVAPAEFVLVLSAWRPADLFVQHGHNSDGLNVKP